MEKFEIDLQDSPLTGQVLAGIHNENLKLIAERFHGELELSSSGILAIFDEKGKDKVERLIILLIAVYQSYRRLDLHDVTACITMVENKEDERFVEVMDQVLTRTHSGKPIKPQTLGQKFLIDQMKSFDLIFSVGPAGTGKTYLAICYAVELLKTHQIKKIILTRPVVEAGESLGFLPGDLMEKVDPYLRPLYDALDDMLSTDKTQRLIDQGIIEIAPLAYMRGRTLNDALVILDEAQNTSVGQMKMFLSRMGRNSKMIVTGDVDQIDLPKHQKSGLIKAVEYLKGIDEISIVHLSHSDIVRHPLVVKILKRFQEGENSND